MSSWWSDGASASSSSNGTDSASGWLNSSTTSPNSSYYNSTSTTSQDTWLTNSTSESEYGEYGDTDDDTGYYQLGWLTFVILLYPAFLLNLITFVLILIRRYNSQNRPFSIHVSTSPPQYPRLQQPEVRQLDIQHPEVKQVEVKQLGVKQVEVQRIEVRRVGEDEDQVINLQELGQTSCDSHLVFALQDQSPNPNTGAKPSAGTYVNNYVNGQEEIQRREEVQRGEEVQGREETPSGEIKGTAGVSEHRVKQEHSENAVIVLHREARSEGPSRAHEVGEIRHATRAEYPMRDLVLYLSFEDGLLSLSCAIQCTINQQDMYYQGLPTACNLQGVYASFGVLSIGYTLCLIAYNSDRLLRQKGPLSSRFIFVAHIVFWIIAVAVSVLSARELSDSRLMPSNVFCFVNIHTLSSGLLFYLFGLSFIVLFIVYRYIKMAFFLRSHLNTHVQSSQTPQRAPHGSGKLHMKAIKRMLLIVLFYLISVMPLLSVNLWELTNGREAGPVTFIVVWFLVHCNSIFDPILYVIFNTRLRKFITSLISSGTRRCRCSSTTE